LNFKCFWFLDQILLPEDIPMTDTPVITGTLLTLKLLLPLFQLPSNQANEHLNTNHISVSLPKTATSLNAVVLERIVQVCQLIFYVGYYLILYFCADL
jgi:hypothetical protein